MNEAAVQLNRKGQSHSGHFQRPLDLSVFGEGHFSAKERIVAGSLYSFSSAEKFCTFTLPEIAARYRMSPATAWRAIHKILTKLFERGKKIKEYKFTGERPDPKDKPYITIYEWLYFATFDFNDEEKDEHYTDYLTDTEIEILCLLRYYEKKRWSTSQNYIADQLGIAQSTASKGFNRLEKMKLIEKKFTDKDVKRAANHHTRAFYTVNEELLAEKKSEIVKRAKGKSDVAKAADERSDREHYYAVLQQADLDRIAALKKKLKEAFGEVYEELEKQLGVLGMDAGKAEAAKNPALLKKILEKRQGIQRAMKAKLELLGLTEHDLEPHFICEKCHDTGDLPNGRACDCWRELRP